MHAGPLTDGEVSPAPRDHSALENTIVRFRWTGRWCLSWTLKDPRMQVYKDAGLGDWGSVKLYSFLKVVHSSCFPRIHSTNMYCPRHIVWLFLRITAEPKLLLHSVHISIQ